MATLSHRRNSAVKIYVNGRTGDAIHGIAKRVGARVSRYSTASVRAQSSLARRVQPTAKREIRKVYGIKTTALNKRMALARGLRRKGDYIALQASTRRLPLVLFGGVWGGAGTAGATATVLLGQRKTYGSAFIAQVGWRGTSGASVKADTASSAIYVRQLQANGKRVGRGPLRRLYGPSVFEMLSPGNHMNQGAMKVRQAVMIELETFYVGELRRQIALELRRG